MSKELEDLNFRKDRANRFALEKRMLNGSLQIEYNKPYSGSNFSIND